jgi:chemotaxis protein CheX
MRFEYIGPFVSSTISVLNSVLQSEISKENVALLRGKELGGEIFVIIRIRDDSGDSVILNMDAKTALRIGNAMNGRDSSSLRPEGMDAISELANMITGNAVSALGDLGFDFHVHPPLIVDRDGVSRVIGDLELFQVPVRTQYGGIAVNFTMRTD